MMMVMMMIMMIMIDHDHDHNHNDNYKNNVYAEEFMHPLNCGFISHSEEEEKTNLCSGF